MQYWIIFQPGVGGDGFANLLEHANNVFPADGKDMWRIHYRDGRHGILDRPVRFSQANWAFDSNKLPSIPMPFRLATLPKTTALNCVYVELIAQQKNTVITAHDNYFKQIADFEYSHIVKQDQVLINLYSNCCERVYQDLITKRPETILEFEDLTKFTNYFESVKSVEFNRSDYAIHIDIEKVRRNWLYLNECLVKLGIDLDKNFYDHYLTYIDNL
jgi:hypothetical protein